MSHKEIHIRKKYCYQAAFSDHWRQWSKFPVQLQSDIWWLALMSRSPPKIKNKNKKLEPEPLTEKVFVERVLNIRGSQDSEFAAPVLDSSFSTVSFFLVWQAALVCVYSQSSPFHFSESRLCRASRARPPLPFFSGRVRYSISHHVFINEAFCILCTAN